jgi:CBS domain protein
MITDRDICMAAYLRDMRLGECVTGEIMGRSVVACRPSDPIEKAESAMREHRIRRLPVNTLTWLASDGSCPDMDGTFDANSDTEITQFPQTLDLTTDTSTAQFFDNDGDGCFQKGAGPAGPFTSTGTCIDLTAQTGNVAGGGTVFSSAAPLHDLLFTTVQNNTISGPTTSGGTSCASPPVINFSGLAHRCIIAP